MRAFFYVEICWMFGIPEPTISIEKIANERAEQVRPAKHSTD
jgi:hypothetical protein